MSYAITVAFLSLVVLGLLYCAMKWESNDIKKFYARRPVYDIKDPVEREKEYMFYSTFNAENHIMWRSLFMSATIASVVIYLFLKNYSDPKKMELNCFVILFIVFLIYYLTHIYRNFHVYRVMASKVKKNVYIMETIGEKKGKENKRKIKTPKLRFKT